MLEETPTVYAVFASRVCAESHLAECKSGQTTHSQRPRSRFQMYLFEVRSFSVTHVPTFVVEIRSAGWRMLSESRSLRGLPHPSRAFCGRVGSGHEHDSHPFSPPRGPLRFDLDNAFRPRSIMNKAAPVPMLRPLHQSALHRVAMDVPQLLDAFRFRPYGKIVIADLPKAGKMFRAQLL